MTKAFEKRIAALKDTTVVSFDAETNGLWGSPFAIAAVVYAADGTETARFVGRCPIEGSVNPWVQENVLPQMVGMEETHQSYEALLADFFAFLAEHKGAVALTHMGHVVESGILRDAHNMGIIGDWDAPYEWFDVCVLFGDSVDRYLEENGVQIGESFAGGTHNPLYDSVAAYKAYRHFLEN